MAIITKSYRGKRSLVGEANRTITATHKGEVVIGGTLFDGAQAMYSIRLEPHEVYEVVQKCLQAMETIQPVEYTLMARVRFNDA